MAAHVEHALQVNREDAIPLLLGHIEAHAIAEDSSAVDQNIYPAELVDACLHHPLGSREIGYALVAGHRLTTCPLDLVHHLLRWSRVLALAG
jgi:hypothetical protein